MVSRIEVTKVVDGSDESIPGEQIPGAKQEVDYVCDLVGVPDRHQWLLLSWRTLEDFHARGNWKLGHSKFGALVRWEEERGWVYIQVC